MFNPPPPMWFFKEISKSNFKHRSKKNLENNRNMIIHKILNWDSLAVYLFRKRLLIAFFKKSYPTTRYLKVL